MKVVITDSAYADLLQIGEDIRRDNPERVATFVEEISDRCKRLGAMPKAFPLLPNWEERGVRRRPYRNYLIFYRVDPGTVEVLHVLHGARDHETVLFPDG